MIDDMLAKEQLIFEAPDVEMLGEALDDLGDDVLDELELMGIDTNNLEYMGKGALKRLFRRIRDRIRARRKARAERKATSALPPEQPYSLTAPGVGTLRAGPQGVSFARPLPTQQLAQAGLVPGGGGPLAMIQKNPMLLIVPAVGLLAVFMMTQQRRR